LPAPTNISWRRNRHNGGGKTTQCGKARIEMIARQSLPAEPDNQSKSHALDAGKVTTKSVFPDYKCLKVVKKYTRIGSYYSGKTRIEMIATSSLPAEPDNQSKSHALDAGFRKHDR